MSRPLLSQLTLSYLDLSRHRDYLTIAIICSIPSLIALALGAGSTLEFEGQTYIGWFDKYNFWPMAILLPMGLWILRRAFARICYVTPSHLPATPPPLVMLFRQATSKETVYHLLRDWVSSPKVMGTALAISLGIQVADLQELVSVYLLDTPVRASELDWSVMYQAGVMSKSANAVFCFFAYIVQFLLTTLGIFGMVFLTAHNLFFLARIYQRSRVKPGEEGNYITLDLDDINRCFGFRAANDAFNTQVSALTIAGFFILTSRFANVEAVDNTASMGQLVQSASIFNVAIFPDIGQILLAIGWFVALFIVAAPALVKLAPRLPYIGSVSELTIDTYLREFLTDEQWHYGTRPSEKQINFVAAKFAHNGFWPTGDNRASLLFFFSFWVFLVILYPIRTDDMMILIPSLAGLGVIAYGLRTILLKGLSSSLSYVDERLATPRPELLAEELEKTTRVQGKVFISYRREDSLAYTRLLHQSLLQYMDESRIFMDMTTIRDGDDFVESIESAIRESDSVIAVIGPRWINCTDSEGVRRLDKTDDFVRLEIATALAQNKLLIPVLVGDAKMPAPDELPADIEPLWRRHARDISDSRWEYDVGELAKVMSGKET